MQLIKEREEFTSSIDHERFSTNASENYYEIIKELANALLLLDGLKTTGEYAHKDLIDYLINYKEFIESDILFLNDLRIKRNNSAYDGKKIEPIYLMNNKNRILELIKRLKKIIKLKLNLIVIITYFVHGTTTDNQKDVSSGWKDVELSELGIKQSNELPNQIGNKKFDVVFCSDLKRAVHSAELTFKGQAPIIQDKRLRECNYGDFNGKLSEIVEPMQEECITKKFPNGESYEDVKKRIADFLKFLKKNYNGKQIAIVAHKAPQLAIEVLLNGMSWKQAFSNDWRKRKSWQPGWEYILE